MSHPMSHPIPTYLNPVYPHSFPDPFVLKYRGEYWAYCTGEWHDGGYFGVLHSRDLVQWRLLAGAMAPLPGGHTHYWAPEVTYDNGRFYMYYSVGNEEQMQIRVAIAEHPAGPFVDSGRRLTSEPFAIDAHVFADNGGERYLFYATDFLEHSHIGTGTARDRLFDPLTLSGRPQPVTRPRYDWHVYDPHRIEKGGVRWHTVEGPFVLKHKRRYYQMFSGGNWQNPSYGVSYATTDDISAPGEWTQTADGERVLPILRTLPGHVVGPGHNSVVRGPDNRQLFCVYHRWVEGARTLAIDRLEWAGERMLVLGPSTAPCPAPLAPTFADFFDEPHDGGLGAGWTCSGGRWRASGAARQESTEGAAEARCAASAPCFTAEVSLRSLDAHGGPGAYGIAVDQQLFFMLEPSRGCIHTRVWWGDYGWEEEQVALPPGFDPQAYHLLRVEANLRRLTITLDDAAVSWSTELLASASTIALRTDSMSAAFSGFAFTAGWEDTFANDVSDPVSLGWHTAGQHGGRDNYRPQDQPAKSLAAYGWRLDDQQLWCTAEAGETFITKDAQLAAYELVINARLHRSTAPDGCYGFYPTLGPGAPGPLLTVEAGADGWALCCYVTAGEQRFRLPDDFDPAIDQQFRFRKQAGRLMVACETHTLGELPVPNEPTSVGLYARHATVAFDMVRVTAIVE
jgi:GH43 family beta-xylosidase